MGDTVQIGLGFILKMLLIFAVIFSLALITPWLAKKVDASLEKHKKKSPARVDDEKAVRSIYDMPDVDDEKTENENKDNGDV